MLGVLIVFQVRILSHGVKYVEPGKLQEYVNEIEREKAVVEQQRLALEDIKEKLALYENPENIDNEDLKIDLHARIGELEKIINYTDVEGPGIIVIIDDSERELYYGENANRVLVHNTDVGIVVDELRAAGAEAVSINGERIVYNSTTIDCVGPTVKINGEQMSAPFIIKAIGNRKYLESAITAPGSFAELLATQGIFVEANTSISVSIDKYEGEINSLIMTEYEEGEE
jgi:uncharacterized protein YlxW (UPF0749 family)